MFLQADVSLARRKLPVSHSSKVFSTMPKTPTYIFALRSNSAFVLLLNPNLHITEHLFLIGL